MYGEHGRDQVEEAVIAGAAMSTVNLSEVTAKLTEHGLSEEDVRGAIGIYRLAWVPFDEEAAVAAGLLRSATRSAGLSLGDRACLALGRERNLPVLTTDRAWSGLDLVPGIEVVLVR